MSLLYLTSQIVSILIIKIKYLNKLNWQYKVIRWIHLWFYVRILTKSRKHMDKYLEIKRQIAQWIGLKLNANKSN